MKCDQKSSGGDDGWSTSLETVRVAGLVLGCAVITLTLIMFAWKLYRSRMPNNDRSYIPVAKDESEFDSLDNQLGELDLEESVGKLAPKSPVSTLFDDDDDLNSRSV